MPNPIILGNAAPRTVDNLIKAQCPRAVSGHTNVEGCEPWSIGTPFGASVALNPAHKIFMYWYIQSEVMEMYLGEILFLTLLHFEELLQAGSCTNCELHFVPHTSGHICENIWDTLVTQARLDSINGTN